MAGEEVQTTETGQLLSFPFEPPRRWSPRPNGPNCASSARSHRLAIPAEGLRRREGLRGWA